MASTSLTCVPALFYDAGVVLVCLGQLLFYNFSRFEEGQISCIFYLKELFFFVPSRTVM